MCKTDNCLGSQAHSGSYRAAHHLQRVPAAGPRQGGNTRTQTQTIRSGTYTVMHQMGTDLAEL